MNKNNGSNEGTNQALSWQKSYVESLIDQLHPFGETLEVGFGFGDAANRIQTYQPKSHTIIEFDPQVAEQAKLWAKDHKNVKVLQGSWEEALADLGVFDTIFFKGHSLNGQEELIVLSYEEMTSASNKAREMLNSLEEHLSKTKRQFSDQEIDDFYEQVGQFNLKKLPDFLLGMKERGNISEKQYKNFIIKYSLGKPSEDCTKAATDETDPMLAFLEECLKKHMKKGSRFSSFILGSTSKYEDSQFLDRIINNPELDYQESPILINTPDGKQISSLCITVKKH